MLYVSSLSVVPVFFYNSFLSCDGRITNHSSTPNTVMSSYKKITVGQDAPAFECKAVVDGRIKGNTHPLSFNCRSLSSFADGTDRDLIVGLHPSQPLAHPDLLPQSMVLHLSHRGSRLQCPPAGIPLQPLLRRRVRQHGFRVLPSGLERCFRHGRRPGRCPCTFDQRLQS